MGIIRLNSRQLIKTGDRIHVTLKNFPKHEWEYRIDTIDLQSLDEFERVTLSLIKEIAPNEQTKSFSEGEKTMTVEPNWFTANPNRNIKIIDKQRLNI